MSIYFTQSGGGGNETLQQVLNNGSTLNNSNTIDIVAGYSLDIVSLAPGTSNSAIQTNNAFVYITNDYFVGLNSYISGVYISSGNTDIKGTNQDFGFSYSDINRNIKIGMLTPSANEPLRMEFREGNKDIVIYGYDSANITDWPTAKFQIDIASSDWYVQFGDLGNAVSGAMLNIDVYGQIISTIINNNIQGLFLDFLNNLFYFGDYNTSRNYLYIDNTIGTDLLRLQAFKNLQFWYDDQLYLAQQPSGVTPITQATHSGASGDYLKVNVNGVDYVIELRNP